MNCNYYKVGCQWHFIENTFELLTRLVFFPPSLEPNCSDGSHFYQYVSSLPNDDYIVEHIHRQVVDEDSRRSSNYIKSSVCLTDYPVDPQRALECPATDSGPQRVTTETMRDEPPTLGIDQGILAMDVFQHFMRRALTM